MGLAAVLVVAGHSGPANATNPGQNGRIAFTRYRLQDKPLWSEIFVADADGSNEHRVSHSTTAVEDDQAHWSPDGRWIVFDRCPSTGPCTIWLVRPDGTGQRRLSKPCHVRAPVVCPDDSGPTFAPDGNHVVFTHSFGRLEKTSTGDEIQHSAIATTDLQGKRLRIIRQLPPYAGDLQAPRVSPDGTLVVFDRFNAASVAPAGADALFVARINGGPARQITPWRLSAGSPDWSPDGKTILFKNSISGAGELTPGTNLYTVSVDGTHLRRVTNVGGNHYVLAGSFSPDGSSMVFATNDGATANPRSGIPFADVFTMHVDGTALTAVTHTANLDGWPDWGPQPADAADDLSPGRGAGAATPTALATPPGKNGKIVFRRYTDAERTAGALFVANPDGSGTRQLTRPPSGRVIDGEPDWSPDGKQVAFQRQDETACGDDSCETDEIWVVNADGTGAHSIAADQPATSCAFDDKPAGGVRRFSPAWSPDGTRVIFACTTPFIPGYTVTGGLCTVNADGSGLRILEPTPSRWYDDGPQYSPDGSRIAFERDLDSSTGDTLRAAVFVMNADGTNIHRITPWSLRAGDHPDWSPDGKRILFTSNVDGPDAVSANKYTIRPDGKGLRQLTHAAGGALQYMSSSYSPDGKWITVARRTRNGNADVYVMRANGTKLRNVTRSPAWDSAPDWGTG